MTEDEEFSILLDKGKLVAAYGVSFLSISNTNNVEDAAIVGSGTLVQLGALRGILTAAHVAKNLPTSGEIGLLRPGSRPVPQRHKMSMELCRTIILEPYTEGPLGTDLAFVGIPIQAAGWLQALSVFYSLTNRYQLRANEEVLEAATGAIAEWTESPVEVAADCRRRVFNSLLRSGSITSTETNDMGCDVLKFVFFESPNTPNS